jgi:hypothetical protein
LIKFLEPNQIKPQKLSKGSSPHSQRQIFSKSAAFSYSRQIPPLSELPVLLGTDPPKRTNLPIVQIQVAEQESEEAKA